jgi:hypothetical protein
MFKFLSFNIELIQYSFFINELPIIIIHLNYFWNHIFIIIFMIYY